MLKDFQICDDNLIQNNRKFSQTLKARSKTDGEYFILKSCPIEDVHALFLLRNEAQFAFDSPSFQNTIKTWEEKGRFYLQKKYIKGLSLDEYIKSIKRRNLKAVVIEIIIKLSFILDELHAQNLLHLDIKPSNIIVNNDDGLALTLIDYGFMWNMDKVNNVRRKSSFAFYYASPELILNTPEIFAPQSDYFSLGVLLYELLEKCRPFSDLDPVKSINLQINVELPKMSRRNKEFYEIIQQLSAKNPFAKPPNQLTRIKQLETLRKGIEMRYSNLNELRYDLEKIVSITNSKG